MTQPSPYHPTLVSAPLGPWVYLVSFPLKRYGDTVSYLLEDRILTLSAVLAERGG